jgi:hypothetical protein
MPAPAWPKILGILPGFLIKDPHTRVFFYLKKKL